VTASGFAPLATVGGITLLHPAASVERVGFHQSNHEGAQALSPLPSTIAPITLESRDRLTSARTAADVVADPAGEIRAPVTGTVKRAGTYVLYCKYSDDYAVIEPDAHPGWEVKILHIDGVRVRTGQRVAAGVTVLAARPTRLPFASQVDDFTGTPAWPHVHIEVVDPAIRNVPSPGGGCS
jgi:biotin carboxyl carrier protein